MRVGEPWRCALAPSPRLFSCRQPSVAHFSSRELARRSEAPGKRPPSFALSPIPRAQTPNAAVRGAAACWPGAPARPSGPGGAEAARHPCLPAIGERERPSPAGRRAAAPGASGPRGAAVTRLGPTASREGGREGGGSGGLSVSVRQPSRRSRGGGRWAAARLWGPGARRSEQGPPVLLHEA